MKPYLIALAVGLLVGVIYGLLNVRSPAPPVIALVGLLGILVGEQLPPLAKRILAGTPVTLSSLREHHAHHLFGPLPRAKAPTREDRV
ncbi:XapX domain-containing protein [Bosea eneae]|uniref:XapX domain-containing protein n=1 Tax=Bosea eneae TaxID=151454 RepID=A0ABW0IZY5_9HYPH